jgi:AcrR family transcriptional regulator
MVDTTRPAGGGAREQARERRQAELARVAYAEIAAKGLEGLRIRDAAAAAGINHATLLHYFPTKAALLDGVIDHLLGELITPVAAPESGGAPTLARQLAHELDDIRERLRTTPEIFVVLTELQARSVRDPDIRASLDRLDHAWIGYLAALVRAGIAAGQCRPDVAPEAAAQLLAAFFRGVSLQALTGRAGDIDALFGQAHIALRIWFQPEQAPAGGAPGPRG